jgi:hypothetical protein
MSNFRPVRTFRLREAPLDVEFPTSADFSTTPVLGVRSGGAEPSLSSPRLPNQLGGLDRIRLSFPVRGA